LNAIPSGTGRLADTGTTQESAFTQEFLNLNA
jgi:hypothetical protein